MNAEKLRGILEGISGYSDKVTYWQWPVSEAPSLPFICFYNIPSTTFAADNKAYYCGDVFNIELYTKFKDVAQEALVEAALYSNDLYFTKEPIYLEDELVWEVVYTVGG